MKSCPSIIILLFLLISENLQAQEREFLYSIEASGGTASSTSVPFWLRANKYGSIPPGKNFLSLIGSVRKEYDTRENRLLDWSTSIEGRLNIGQKSNLILIEGFGKIRLSIFEFKAGREKELMGLCDSILTSGSFSISGNALGIPKIQISIPEFYYLPIFKSLFAVKGSLAHGWIGKIPVRSNDSEILLLDSYLHQKSVYLRIGKPNWKIRLYGGINHQVFWGNEKIIFGNDFDLTPFESYIYVLSGRSYSNVNIPSSSIGNHLGSVDFGLEYEFKNIRLLAYRQNIYDYGYIIDFNNISDGLNGLSFINRNHNYSGFQWKRVLFEFLYTKNHAGELNYSLAQNYFNNYKYIEGWSYKGVCLGTPFISQENLTREGLTSDGSYFINNRVMVFHFGMEGSAGEWNLSIKTSYSKNYGNYKTGIVLNTFDETNQLSVFASTGKKLSNGLAIGFITAFDVGGLYDNSFGINLNVSKSF
jgi:hypothetical protein